MLWAVRQRLLGRFRFLSRVSRLLLKSYPPKKPSALASIMTVQAQGRRRRVVLRRPRWRHLAAEQTAHRALDGQRRGPRGTRQRCSHRCGLRAGGRDMVVDHCFDAQGRRCVLESCSASPLRRACCLASCRGQAVFGLVVRAGRVNSPFDDVTLPRYVVAKIATWCMQHTLCMLTDLVAGVSVSVAATGFQASIATSIRTTPG
jgi:hypothetical protein